MTQFENFTYQGNKLFCESTDVEIIAKKQGTPLYVYSYKSLVEQFRRFDAAFTSVDRLICFAVKANPNKAILRTFFALGAGADVVSGGELRRAVAAGCDPKKIVFSGVGKTSEEIHLALNEDIRQFNVESEQELHNIQRIASFLDKRAAIAVRVNPDVDAKTHPYISTGLKNNKFGVGRKQALDLYRAAKGMSHIDIVGMGCHIGSQLVDIAPFADTMSRLRELVLELKSAGIMLQSLDVGGGLGIRYKDEPVRAVEDYAQMILNGVADLGLKIIFV
jgi:diaminopimelate decarboxylase